MCSCFSAPARTVKFVKHGSSTPEGHLTGTISICQPDLIAIPADSPSNTSQLSILVQSPPSQSHDIPKSQSSESSEKQRTPWSDVASVVEFVSKGTTRCDGTKQGVAYTSYLLQQRPDRVAVCGLRISLSLILVDAAAVYSTTLHWDGKSARNLLLRVLYYINVPPISMTDPTITPKDNTYTINIKSQEYGDTHSNHVDTPLGIGLWSFNARVSNAW